MGQRGRYAILTRRRSVMTGRVAVMLISVSVAVTTFAQAKVANVQDKAPAQDAPPPPPGQNTDPHFAKLVASLSDKNMFVREQGMKELASLKEPRCIPPLLDVLKNDEKAQLRAGVAYELQAYDDPRVKAALLKSLGDVDSVAHLAAYSLGCLHVQEAIKPTYDLVYRDHVSTYRERALDGLIQNRCKQAMPLLLDLMEKLPALDKMWGERLSKKIDANLMPYAKATEEALGPPPDTIEQWKQWWHDAEPLFTDTMELRPPPAETCVWVAHGCQPSDLKFTAKLGAHSYRPGDPIRLVTQLTNTSGKPCKTIPPDIWGNMAWGIQLKRVQPDVDVVLNFEPSGCWVGSFRTPHTKELKPGCALAASRCLEDWLPNITWRQRIARDKGTKEANIWPLKPGTYELTVKYDSTKYDDFKTDPYMVLGMWAADTIRFEVAGKVREDPRELLELIAAETGNKWLLTDLTSKRASRRDAAWQIIVHYGDTRLLPFLENTIGEATIPNEHYRPALKALRPFPPPTSTIIPRNRP